MSQTHAGIVYEVDTAAQTCNCLDFPQVSFCKHLYAISILYPQIAIEIPVAECQASKLQSSARVSSPETETTDSTSNHDDEVESSKEHNLASHLVKNCRYAYLYG